MLTSNVNILLPLNFFFHEQLELCNAVHPLVKLDIVRHRETIMSRSIIVCYFKKNCVICEHNLYMKISNKVLLFKQLP